MQTAAECNSVIQFTRNTRTGPILRYFCPDFVKDRLVTHLARSCSLERITSYTSRPSSTSFPSNAVRKFRTAFEGSEMEELNFSSTLTSASHVIAGAFTADVVS